MQSKSKSTTQSGKKPIKCWGCGENHILKDRPHRDPKGIHHVNEAKTVEDTACALPRINATLDNCQVDHPSVIVEMPCKIN